MNLIICYDTETTGFPDFKARSDAPHQPKLVQLAAVLADADTRCVLQSINVIIRPDGWDIPDEASRIHGITTEMAYDIGIKESVALEMFMSLWMGRTRVAHNQGFDARILRIAQHRHKQQFNAADIERWKDGFSECTAIKSKPICMLPPSEAMLKTNLKNSYKTPTLQEAYTHFNGREFDNAHSAMADVEACLSVFWSIEDFNQEAAA